MEVGDLPGRKCQPHQAVIGLFRYYRGGPAGGQRGPRGPVEALRLIVLRPATVFKSASHRPAGRWRRSPCVAHHQAPRAKRTIIHARSKMQLGRSDWGFHLSREKLYGGSLWSNTTVTVQGTAHRLLLGFALQK